MEVELGFVFNVKFGFTLLNVTITALLSCGAIEPSRVVSNNGTSNTATRLLAPETSSLILELLKASFITCPPIVKVAVVAAKGPPVFSNEAPPVIVAVSFTLSLY